MWKTLTNIKFKFTCAWLRHFRWCYKHSIQMSKHYWLHWMKKLGDKLKMVNWVKNHHAVRQMESTICWNLILHRIKLAIGFVVSSLSSPIPIKICVFSRMWTSNWFNFQRNKFHSFTLIIIILGTSKSISDNILHQNWTQFQNMVLCLRSKWMQKFFVFIVSIDR